MEAVSNRRAPKLWVERLLIVQSLQPLTPVRDISLRPGLNIVWAKEPENRDGLGPLQRAGHGVGKSTFCLMLRCLLGDAGKAVRSMRQLLTSELPNGGVGAVVHFGNQTWAVYRPFAAKSHGQAAESADLEGLLNGGEHVPFQRYLEALQDAMLGGLQQTHIPGTGQAIEWGHVLSWLSRDQGTRLSSYYNWRSTEGTGLQGARQAQPWVLRSVLGLTDAPEIAAAGEASELERKIELLEGQIKSLEERPRLVRERIEADFRGWLGQGDDLDFYSDDLFRSSVTKEIEKKEQDIATAIAEVDEEIDEHYHRMLNFATEADKAKGQAELARASFEEAEALRDQDQERLTAAREKLSELQRLEGPCEYGAVDFQACEHIRRRIETFSFQEQRDQRAIQRDTEFWRAEAEKRQPAVMAAERRKELAEQALETASAQRRKLQMKRDTRQVELAVPRVLRDSMKNWEDAAGEASSPALSAKREELQTLREGLDSAKARILDARNGQLTRASRLTQTLDALAKEIGLNGRFRLDDDSRPFELVGSAGEAYSVLEILLGDFTCALDAQDTVSSFPGITIHDCPREADLSHGLYRDYLTLIAGKEGECPAWQVIVTTTTPPPESLTRRPWLALELHPESDDGLLLRSRFGLRARPAEGVRDAVEGIEA